MEEDDAVDLIMCPISFDVMENAVSAPCGHSFSENSIKSWLEKTKSCPSCSEPIDDVDKLVPNYTLRAIIEKWNTFSVALETPHADSSESTEIPMEAKRRSLPRQRSSSESVNPISSEPEMPLKLCVASYGVFGDADRSVDVLKHMEKMLTIQGNGTLTIKSGSKTMLPGFGDPDPRSMKSLFVRMLVYGFPVTKLISENDPVFITPDLLQIQKGTYGELGDSFRCVDVTAALQSGVHSSGRGVALTCPSSTPKHKLPGFRDPAPMRRKQLNIVFSIPAIYGPYELEITVNENDPVFVAADKLQITQAVYGVIGTKRSRSVCAVLQQMIHANGGNNLLITENVVKNKIPGFGDPARMQRKELLLSYRFSAHMCSKRFDEYEGVFITTDPLQILSATFGNKSVTNMLQEWVHTKGEGTWLDLNAQDGQSLLSQDLLQGDWQGVGGLKVTYQHRDNVNYVEFMSLLETRIAVDDISP